ncbi:MAG: bifunctional phosphoribosylaminoimidazolecarboxamide formyltransferase/IMP cyclohydrolase [Betaproteobacteria bacterium]|nr:bifunctional phosphoribosylaminoimidazolecarboxamide formyltransferase/IMP cyclohydrolase [Betaproteobacteria bacterium]
MRINIRQALISVSNKVGAVDFARSLERAGVAILSTGGTAKLLADAGIAVTEVADYTGYPEMLDGRVKTLHPKIHAGILAKRDDAAHMAALREAGAEPIDLVVVNLYPFGETVARPGCSLADAIENIDVGGPTMVRAAAKNYAGVAVVTDPHDYPLILDELHANNGSIGLATRLQLARQAFAHTAAYDGAISNYLSATGDTGTRVEFPATLNLQLTKMQDLRYGENPHQHAALYRDALPPAGSLARYRQLQGKELSFNNIADADAAWECVKGFAAPTCVIVKHANPCGVAERPNLEEAYLAAFATDPTSAFGGIIACNGAIDAAVARAITRQFVEVLVAPAFDAGALEVLAAKQNIRVLEVPLHHGIAGFYFKRTGGGFLVQSPDARNVGVADLRVVTQRSPTADEQTDLLFAWRVAKYVKSNAIVFCGKRRTLGIGAGQMSRIDSTRIAVLKAGSAGLSLSGAVVASDAFFPFRDGIDVLATSGAKAVIQPGGSVRDEEVIAAANEHGIAMLLTGVRHFRH